MADKQKRDKQNGSSRVLASNSFMEALAVRRPAFMDGTPAIVAAHERLMPDRRAVFAMTCIERWGMVAAQVDGEDSVGRAKLRRMTPEEVVKHAIDCAAMAFEAFGREGWLLPVPSFPDILDAVKDAENTND